MSLSTHCLGHIMTGSFEGSGNQYMQLVKVLYCKLPINSKQLLVMRHLTHYTARRVKTCNKKIYNN